MIFFLFKFRREKILEIFQLGVKLLIAKIHIQKNSLDIYRDEN